MKNADKPAFTFSEVKWNADDSYYESTDHTGLSKREYFAAMAMQGYLANSAETDVTTAHVRAVLGLEKETEYVYAKHYTSYVAKLSVQYADALLTELEKEQK